MVSSAALTWWTTDTNSQAGSRRNYLSSHRLTSEMSVSGEYARSIDLCVASQWLQLQAMKLSDESLHLGSKAVHESG
jgi:hypothetical protein